MSTGTKCPPAVAVPMLWARYSRPYPFALNEPPRRSMSTYFDPASIPTCFIMSRVSRDTSPLLPQRAQPRNASRCISSVITGFPDRRSSKFCRSRDSFNASRRDCTSSSSCNALRCSSIWLYSLLSVSHFSRSSAVQFGWLSPCSLICFASELRCSCSSCILSSDIIYAPHIKLIY